MDVKAKSKEEAEQIVKCEIGEYLEKITGIITKEEDDKFSAFMKNREKRNHKVAYNG